MPARDVESICLPVLAFSPAGGVTGSFDGRPFVFVSRASANQEQEFATPQVVAADATLDVTLLADLSTWFVDDTHTHLVDPDTAAPGQPNEQLVAWNIRTSFHAFHDGDHDGRDDDLHP